MKLVLSSAALGAALIAAAGVTASAQSPAATAARAMHAPTQIKLEAQNNSGEAGTATLLDGAKGLIVKLRVEGGPAGVLQPVHIHKGTCDKLDPKPTYPLTTLKDGMSETTIPGLTLASLLKSPFAINIHKSTTEIPTYVACGNIAQAK